MLKNRTLSALALLLIFLAAVWWGHFWFSLLIAMVAVLGAGEFYNLLKRGGATPYFAPGYAFILLFVLRPYLDNFWLILASIPVALVVSLLLQPPRLSRLASWGWTWAGVFYLGWLLSWWANLYSLPSGREWVLLGLGAVFACDTAAFFAGRSLGKHRLAPAISPSKSWEGAIAGFTAAILAVLVLNSLFRLPLSYGEGALLGFLVGFLAQLGDLVESWLKRSVSAKDSSSLIPGHGGMLDRLDSVVFVGIVLYYFVLWVT